MLVWALFCCAVKTLKACQHHWPASTHNQYLKGRRSLARRGQLGLQSQDFFSGSNPPRAATLLNALQILANPQPQQAIFGKLLAGHALAGLLRQSLGPRSTSCRQWSPHRSDDRVPVW